MGARPSRHKKDSGGKEEQGDQVTADLFFFGSHEKPPSSVKGGFELPSADKANKENTNANDYNTQDSTFSAAFGCEPWSCMPSYITAGDEPNMLDNNDKQREDMLTNSNSDDHHNLNNNGGVSSASTQGKPSEKGAKAGKEENKINATDTDLSTPRSIQDRNNNTNNRMNNNSSSINNSTNNSSSNSDPKKSGWMNSVVTWTSGLLPWNWTASASASASTADKTPRRNSLGSESFVSQIDEETVTATTTTAASSRRPSISDSQLNSRRASREITRVPLSEEDDGWLLSSLTLGKKHSEILAEEVFVAGHQGNHRPVLPSIKPEPTPRELLGGRRPAHIDTVNLPPISPRAKTPPIPESLRKIYRRTKVSRIVGSRIMDTPSPAAIQKVANALMNSGVPFAAAKELAQMSTGEKWPKPLQFSNQRFVIPTGVACNVNKLYSDKEMDLVDYSAQGLIWRLVGTLVGNFNVSKQTDPEHPENIGVYDIILVFPYDNPTFVKFIGKKEFVLLVRRRANHKTFEEIDNQL